MAYSNIIIYRYGKAFNDTVTPFSISMISGGDLVKLASHLDVKVTRNAKATRKRCFSALCKIDKGWAGYRYLLK